MSSLRMACVFGGLLVAAAGCQTGTEEGAGETQSESSGAEAPNETGTSGPSTDSDSETETETETDSETETSTGGEPPLSNGPSGEAVMENSCAPDDGLAWQFTIGLVDACDAGQPDPSQPYVRINIYDFALLDMPVGTTSEWTEFEHASAWYAPEGSMGMEQTASAGSVHIESWDNEGEVGSTINGWYTLTLDDQSEIGGAFAATFCGGDPLCG